MSVDQLPDYKQAVELRDLRSGDFVYELSEYRETGPTTGGQLMTSSETMTGTIVAVSPNYWGAGRDLAEAKRNLRKQGGSTAGEHLILTFDDDTEFLGIDELGRYHYNGNPPVEQVIDRRRHRDMM